MYWVYILKSNSINDNVVGQTADLENKIDNHRSGKEENVNTVSDWHLVYSKTYTSQTKAQKVENFIEQQKNNGLIEQVITGRINPDILPG